MRGKRILMSALGVFLLAVGVSITKTAAMGVDPYQSLVSGLDLLLPFGFGNVYLLLNLFFLAFDLLVDRSHIGVATFINLFFLGHIAQIGFELLCVLLPSPTLPLRLLFLVLGIVVLCLASSLYMTADMGVSTYDAVAIILSDKWKLASFRVCRIGTDLSCVLLGAGVYVLSGGELTLLTQIIGIGTLITAFFMGPLIDLFNRKVARPLLERSQSGA